MTASKHASTASQNKAASGYSEGVHSWTDSRCNSGYQLVGSTRREASKASIVQDAHIFSNGYVNESTPLATYMELQQDADAIPLLVLDHTLLPKLRYNIVQFFDLCKTRHWIRDYHVHILHLESRRGSMDDVLNLLGFAKSVGLRRRDQFIAIGGTALGNVVGFSAATYRRSTNWMYIPLAPSFNPTNCELDYMDSMGHVHEDVLTLYHPAKATFMDPSLTICEENLPNRRSCVDEALERIEYHVIKTSKIFDLDNTTLIQQYCQGTSIHSKRKVLVVVDLYPSCDMGAIMAYFEYYRLELDQFTIVPLEIAGLPKDWSSTMRLLDAALELDMSQSDLFIAVGGGTLMDMVGFAAAIFKGGVPYLRIPTTLVGIIDAGVGVKVGINLGLHKNLVGRYYAPVGCLNDPESFLHTLPPQEYACGMAEALKMAIIKSSKLFELIAQHPFQHDVDEELSQLIDISILTMLEELQPNLYEHDLRRVVDFGHEFGHIVESLTRYEARHGECVAVGIGLSTYLAYLKGIIPHEVRDKILHLIVELRLPLWLPNHDCCNPEILWDKICTDATSHKNGKLLLVIPQSVGTAGFLDDIKDVSLELVRQAIDALRLLEKSQRLANSHSDRLPLDHECYTGPSSGSVPRGIIGASGDLGSHLVRHLNQRQIPTLSLIRAMSLQKFKERTVGVTALSQIELGDMLHLPSIIKMIKRVTVLYCFAAAVTLSSKPIEYANVLALNGFGQGIITSQIKLLGRSEEITVVYPSTQRVHLIIGNPSVEAWVNEAVRDFHKRSRAIMEKNDVTSAIQDFAQQFLSDHPLPQGFNIYEVSKRLGEKFTCDLPHHVILRVSSAYGPGLRRGFIYRSLHPAHEGKVETREKRDFIHIDDLNEILTIAPFGKDRVFDAASGESLDVECVWGLIRLFMKDFTFLTFEDPETECEMTPNPEFARSLLGRDFKSIRVGLQSTVDEYLRIQRANMPVSVFHYPQEWSHPHAGQSSYTVDLCWRNNQFEIVESQPGYSDGLTGWINAWTANLSPTDNALVLGYIKEVRYLSVRLQGGALTNKLGQFIAIADRNRHRAIFNIHAGLYTPGVTWHFSTLTEDVFGRQFFHFVRFLRRGRRLLTSQAEIDQEALLAKDWRGLNSSGEKAHIVSLDIGATHSRCAILDREGRFLQPPTRSSSPGKLSHPAASLEELQIYLGEFILSELRTVEFHHGPITNVAISIGIVISSTGIVHDASVFWGQQSYGFDLRDHLNHLMPGVCITILNDVSAAAWRYSAESRFCLITVSSGLSNKVFDRRLDTLTRLDLNEASTGGEMGHVVVEPRLVSDLVIHAQKNSLAHPQDFQSSHLWELVKGDYRKITARALGTAIVGGDFYATELAADMAVPCCQCGNLADLCSYSSGRGALQIAQSMMCKSQHPNIDINDEWLRKAIDDDHPVALEVLSQSTRHLAIRILQLAADLGLNKFIIVGGFAHKVGRTKYIKAIQDHLAHLYFDSGYFAGWNEKQVRRLVQLGISDDNDGLIGIANYARHLTSHYRAVVKSINHPEQQLVTRKKPICGAGEIVLKVLYSGICTTDLQILRGQRSLEPCVLGHEGVCQVVEVGDSVQGLSLGTLVILNPNNPMDEHEKIGHNQEGLYQEYFKLGKEFLDRGQIMKLDRSTAMATDTLVEPLACVVAAEQRVKHCIPGKNILVVGAGMMGLLFVLLCQKIGARNVFLANRSSSRLQDAVDQGIISAANTTVLGELGPGEEFVKVTRGEEIDLVFIVVSMGQGPVATKHALSYVRPGGSVYLFAGFAANATLSLRLQGDIEERISLGDIRSTWGNEKVCIDGKEVTLTGHRGCNQGDLLRASKLIDEDVSRFGRVLSHIISLDTVPAVVDDLLQGRPLCGLPAKRVVIDMSAKEGTIELASSLPLRHLRQAACTPGDQICPRNRFLEYGRERDSPMLGWVYPPRWQDIAKAYAALQSTSLLENKLHVIFIGTGSWGFLVDALSALTSVKADRTVETLQTLEPRQMEALLAQKDLSATLCIGMSKSGDTMETMMLMSTLQKRYEESGLSYRDHFLWLSDLSGGKQHSNGEQVIRAHANGIWKDAHILPLSLKHTPDINALFAMPHSSPVWLAIALLSKQGITHAHTIYHEYMQTREDLLKRMEPAAKTVAENSAGDICLSLNDDMPHDAKLLATQLIEQALGSKRVGFNPRVLVLQTLDSSLKADIELVLPAEISGTARLLLMMDSLAHFTAILGYYLQIPFVSHPGVSEYKQLAKTFYESECFQPPAPVAADIIVGRIAKMLQHDRAISFIQILLFGSLHRAQYQAVENWLASHSGLSLPSIKVDVFNGEVWNHSMHQAARQRRDTLFVVLVEHEYNSTAISSTPMRCNARMLRAIAQATYNVLQPSSLLFAVASHGSIADGISHK